MIDAFGLSCVHPQQLVPELTTCSCLSDAGIVDSDTYECACAQGAESAAQGAYPAVQLRRRRHLRRPGPQRRPGGLGAHHRRLGARQRSRLSCTVPDSLQGGWQLNRLHNQLFDRSRT